MSEVLEAGFGKRGQPPLSRSVADVNNTNPILEYILGHVRGDERPYLSVQVRKRTLLGLLDTGASRTIVGRPGWQRLSECGFSYSPAGTVMCTVANGERLRDRKSVV